MRKDYHKLVRDRIPEIIEEIIEREGKAFEVRVLDEAVYRETLRRKVVEEAPEIADAPEEELAKEIGKRVVSEEHEMEAAMACAKSDPRA